MPWHTGAMALTRMKPEAGHKRDHHSWHHRDERKVAANKARRAEDRRQVRYGHDDARMVLGAVVVGLLIAAVGTPADALVLCLGRGGALKAREQCRAQETQIDPAALGLQGPAGEPGPRGEPGECPCPTTTTTTSTTTTVPQGQCTQGRPCEECRTCKSCTFYGTCKWCTDSYRYGCMPLSGACDEVDDEQCD